MDDDEDEEEDDDGDGDDGDGDGDDDDVSSLLVFLFGVSSLLFCPWLCFFVFAFTSFFQLLLFFAGTGVFSLMAFLFFCWCFSNAVFPLCPFLC